MSKQLLRSEASIGATIFQKKNLKVLIMMQLNLLNYSQK